MKIITATKILFITFSFLFIGTGLVHAQAGACDGLRCIQSGQSCGVNEVQVSNRITCASGIGCCPTSIKVGGGVSKYHLDRLNPLYSQGSPVLAEELSTPGGIINRFIQNYAFPLAGLILFVMLVWGGFEMLSGAANKKSIDAGKQRITAAVIGFVLLFAAYWIIQIIEAMFGLSIL